MRVSWNTPITVLGYINDIYYISYNNDDSYQRGFINEQLLSANKQNRKRAVILISKVMYSENKNMAETTYNTMETLLTSKGYRVKGSCKATKTGDLQPLLLELMNDTKYYDDTVIYICTHGSPLTGTYTSKYPEIGTRKTGSVCFDTKKTVASYLSFMDVFSSIQGKLTVIIDSCYSGQIETMAELYAKKGLIDPCKVQFVCSSTYDAPSPNPPWQEEASVAKYLRKALDEKAAVDTDNDGKLSAAEFIAYKNNPENIETGDSITWKVLSIRVSADVSQSVVFTNENLYLFEY